MTEHEKHLIDEKFASAAERTEAYKRLEENEPLAYILGEWYFYRETYRVTPDVFIPRPDTEILVEAAVSHIPRGGVFADLCTGSGCIAISVLRSRPDLRATAVDISIKALEIASENAFLNGVEERITFIKADVTSVDFTEKVINGRLFDALLSNPPYIGTEIIPALDRAVQKEPRIALDGGQDGLRFYRILNELRHKICVKDAPVLLEIGYDQALSVLEIFRGGEILKDYGGNDRVFII